MPVSGAPARRDLRSDAELVRDMASGRSEALAALYDRHSGLVYSLCFRIVRDRSDAEEVLSDVFWELWKRAGAYEAGRSSVLTYLLTIARCRAIDRRRRRPKLRLQALEQAEAPAASDVPETPSVETTDEVRKALASLDDSQRRAIEYSFWEDLSHSQIAAKMNRPLGTVKTWIRQGLSRISTSLRKAF